MLQLASIAHRIVYRRMRKVVPPTPHRTPIGRATARKTVVRKIDPRPLQFLLELVCFE
jgi:hypothetical protein